MVRGLALSSLLLGTAYADDLASGSHCMGEHKSVLTTCDGEAFVHEMSAKGCSWTFTEPCLECCYPPDVVGYGQNRVCGGEHMSKITCDEDAYKLKMSSMGCSWTFTEPCYQCCSNRGSGGDFGDFTATGVAPPPPPATPCPCEGMKVTISGAVGAIHSDKQGLYKLDEGLVGGHSVYKLEDSHKTMFLYFDTHDTESRWMIGPYADSPWGLIAANPTNSCPSDATGFAYSHSRVIDTEYETWHRAAAGLVAFECVSLPASATAASSPRGVTASGGLLLAAVLCSAGAVLALVAAPRLVRGRTSGALF